MKRLSLLVMLVASPALARPGDGVKEEDIERKSEISDSVASGAVLPWSVGARHEREGILINTFGGFDQANDAPVMTGTLELTIVKRLTLRATAMNQGMSEQPKPGFGMLYDVSRESLDTGGGIDVALGGDYELVGWNRNPALITRVAAGKTAGYTRLQANAGFGLATAGGERFGDLRLSGLHPVAEGLYAGLDSRARIDLERDGDEPVGELDWDMHAGPIATLALGRFAVSATGGVSAWKLRSRETARVGAIGAVGLGAVF